MLRDDVLKELEANRDNPISGQEIADRYKVSRNAVWKAINQLKKEGYSIISSKNSGYVLEDGCDIISEQGIVQYLSEKGRKLHIEKYQTIDSTNNEAKRRIADGEYADSLIVADEQTKGRGRLGRAFYSPMEKGIYMTLLIKVKDGIESPMLITMAAAVAVVRAIEELSGVRPGIKWVNDIFIDDKKVCGILTEATTDLETGRIENLVVGIGINIKEQVFPENLKDIAATLGNDKINRNELIAHIVNWLMVFFEKMDKSLFMDDYIKHCFVIGKRVKFDCGKEKEEGEILSINLDGSLKIKYDEEKIANIFTGEIILNSEKKC